MKLIYLVIIIGFLAGAGLVSGACIVPSENLSITTSGVFCNGTYSLNDVGDEGSLIWGDDNVWMTCNNTIFLGNNSGTGRTNKNITITGILCPLADTCIVTLDYNLGEVHS